MSYMWVLIAFLVVVAIAIALSVWRPGGIAGFSISRRGAEAKIDSSKSSTTTVERVDAKGKGIHVTAGGKGAHTADIKIDGEDIKIGSKTN